VGNEDGDDEGGDLHDVSPTTGDTRRVVKRIVPAVVIALLVLLTVASPAAAHAALSSTEPAAGAALDEPPDEVAVTFTESVETDDDAIKVFDAGGSRLDTGDVQRPDSRTVVVALEGIDEGGYVVTWQVVSADGHPISGAFTWRVGDAAAVDPAVIDDVLGAQQPNRAVGVAFALVRGLVFASLLVLVGGTGVVAVLWPAGRDRGRVRRLLWTSLVVLLVGTVAGIGLQAADTGLSVADVLMTTFGKTWLTRVELLVPATVLLARLRDADRRWWRFAGGAVALGLLATQSLSGHADSGRWQDAAKALDITHLAAASAWLGGLAILVIGAVRRDVPEAQEVASRFSPVAFGAVIVVVLTGTVQSIRQVTSLDALETSYGRYLAIKVVLVLTLIGVASLARSAVQGRLAVQGEPIVVLRRIVAVEVAIAIAIVGVTAMLVDANPSDASDATGGPFDETVVLDDGDGGDVIVNVVVVPGTVGPTDIHVYVDNPSGGLTPPVDAIGTLSLPSGGITGLDVPFVTAGPSHWSANDLDIPIAGEWELELQLLLTDVDEVTATFTVPIGGSS
jgi:copper transport protein